MTQYVTQATIGQQVTFTSKNPTDATKYVGVVEGLITASLAPQYGDITSYNAAVQRADPTVGSLSSLSYFLITLSNGQATPTTRVFASDWISPGSFSVIQAATIYNFNIYDLPGNGVSSILSVLLAAGYNAVQVTDPAALALTSEQGTTTTVSTTV